MHIYSNKIVRFIQEIKIAIKEILSREVGLKVSQNRFFDHNRLTSYPIHVVIYNNRSMLGYFDPEFLELGFHERLMHASRGDFLNIIRHELAHYITSINYGYTQSHGKEFHTTCTQFGWGEEVSRATICLEEGAHSLKEETAILRRVKKLMALATSSNEFEAEQAMLKARELLLEHNMEIASLNDADEEKFYLKRILKQRKKDWKMSAIATILQTFFVSPVFNRGKEFTYLEISGSEVNIEIAEYVAKVLELELDIHWQRAQKQDNLRGKVAKNSFFYGIAKGYLNKIQALKKVHSEATTSALLVIEKKLEHAKNLAYRRLSSSRMRGTLCPKSHHLGEKAGRDLTINPAIRRSTASSPAYLVHK